MPIKHNYCRINQTSQLPVPGSFTCQSLVLKLFDCLFGCEPHTFLLVGLWLWFMLEFHLQNIQLDSIRLVCDGTKALRFLSTVDLLVLSTSHSPQNWTCQGHFAVVLVLVLLPKRTAFVKHRITESPSTQQLVLHANFNKWLEIQFNSSNFSFFLRFFSASTCFVTKHFFGGFLQQSRFSSLQNILIMRCFNEWLNVQTDSRKWCHLFSLKEND